jgi:hypothetical protein
MKVDFLFDKEDTKKIIFESFCNGGLTELNGSSIIVDFDTVHNNSNYKNAKKRLQEQGKKSICFEDVCVEILSNGDTIEFTDYEGDDEIISLSLKTAEAYINSLDLDEKLELKKIIDEDTSCDAWDYYNALQFCMFGEVIYG